MVFLGGPTLNPQPQVPPPSRAEGRPLALHRSRHGPQSELSIRLSLYLNGKRSPEGLGLKGLPRMTCAQAEAEGSN